MKPIVNLLVASGDAVTLINFVTLTGVVLFIVVLAFKRSVRGDPPRSDAFVHWSQDELRPAFEVLNPTPEQKQVVEVARARFDQQVPETIQRQAGLWALDYFERTHRLILSLWHDESAINRVMASSPHDVERAARSFFPDDAPMRLWFLRFASVDILSHGKMAIECVRGGDGLQGVDNWLGFYREVLSSGPAYVDRLGDPGRLNQLAGRLAFSKPRS